MFTQQPCNNYNDETEWKELAKTRNTIYQQTYNSVNKPTQAHTYLCNVVAALYVF